MFCQTCGMANPDSRQFCSKCGKPLPSSAAARVTPAPAAVRASSSEAPPPFTGDAPTSGKAIASLVCGIFTFFLPASVAAIILGHISLSEIRNSAGRIGGRGLATTGLVLGYLGLIIIPVMIVAAIAVPNLLHARVAANEASAVGSLRSVNTAAIIYAARFENGFPSSLDVLGEGTAGDVDLQPSCNAGPVAHIGSQIRIHVYVHSAVSGRSYSTGHFTEGCRKRLHVWRSFRLHRDRRSPAARQNGYAQLFHRPEWSHSIFR